MGKWKELTKKIERLLRVKTFPVAFKLLENEEDLYNNKWVRIPKKKEPATLCQLITRVRTFDWTVGATKEQLATPICPYMLGILDKPPQIVKDGTYRAIKWFKSTKVALKYESVFPKIEPGSYEAVILAPLFYDPFDPDIVLIYGNAAQMIVAINALQFFEYERFTFHCVGESSCTDYIAQCYNTGKPALSIPCYGERRYGHAQDDELVIALPASMLEDPFIKGLEELYKRGIRYPIPYYGAEVDPRPGLFDAYGGSSKYRKQKVKYKK
ncbi:MAG: hypothetical protein GF329_06115 [Candidatus Lokiarchaeota archaeon]|nr:hypothetical protein [Candidatus Lokiarchaeota archaeon]